MIIENRELGISSDQLQFISDVEELNSYRIKLIAHIECVQNEHNLHKSETGFENLKRKSYLSLQRVLLAQINSQIKTVNIRDTQIKVLPKYTLCKKQLSYWRDVVFKIVDFDTYKQYEDNEPKLDGEKNG